MYFPLSRRWKVYFLKEVTMKRIILVIFTIILITGCVSDKIRLNEYTASKGKIIVQVISVTRTEYSHANSKDMIIVEIKIQGEPNTVLNLPNPSGIGLFNDKDNFGYNPYLESGSWLSAIYFYDYRRVANPSYRFIVPKSFIPKGFKFYDLPMIDVSGLISH
jgi:hypothetical protein